MLRRIFYTIVMCVFVVGGCYAIENEEGFSNGGEGCQVDNHGCNNDGTIENSCYGMSFSVSGVFSGTAGCMTRNDVEQTGVYITNTNWGTAYKQYNSFCLCSQECSGGNVEVRPCGNGDDACASGYHWVSGTGCVQNSGCQNCSSTSWAVTGNFVESMTEAVCNNGTCNRTTKYRCAANYYSAAGKSSAPTPSELHCTACASGSTSSAGSTSCVNNSTPTQQTCTKTCYSWTSTGSFEIRRCDCGNAQTYEYRCGAGYYAGNAQSGGISDSGANVLKCTKCPKIDNVQSKSSAGSTGKSACCISPGDTGEDDSGPFVIESKCCAA